MMVDTTVSIINHNWVTKGVILNVCVRIPENLSGLTMELQFLLTSHFCRGYCIESYQKSLFWQPVSGSGYPVVKSH